MRNRFVFLLFLASNLGSQDSLNIELLSKISKEFTIESGELKGPGADFLKLQTSESQYTMLGEYHGSKAISEFTEALIPILDDHNYKMMALEVGPVSADILSALSEDSKETTSNLFRLNEKYKVMEEGDDDAYVPIPFFSNTEDAQFLARARSKDWKIIGIDQEFIFSYLMLSDQMFEILNKSQKARFTSQYKSIRDSIILYMEMEMSDEKDLATSLLSSSIFQDFLAEMEKTDENKATVEAIEKSLQIYKYYDDRKWYLNNKVRIDYMKEQLRKGFTTYDFDISKDKLLIKMGGYHLSKGQSPLSFLEVGNTLYELAAFHGNKSINIAFTNRYYEDEGEVVDIMETENNFRKRLLHLAQIGREDMWVVVDLRRLRPGIHYYPLRHLVNEHVQDLVERYDLLIIPPTEKEATLNYLVGKSVE